VVSFLRILERIIADDQRIYEILKNYDQTQNIQELSQELLELVDDPDESLAKEPENQSPVAI